MSPIISTLPDPVEVCGGGEVSCGRYKQACIFGGMYVGGVDLGHVSVRGVDGITSDGSNGDKGDMSWHIGNVQTAYQTCQKIFGDEVEDTVDKLAKVRQRSFIRAGLRKASGSFLTLCQDAQLFISRCITPPIRSPKQPPITSKLYCSRRILWASPVKALGLILAR